MKNLYFHYAQLKFKLPDECIIPVTLNMFSTKDKPINQDLLIKRGRAKLETDLIYMMQENKELCEGMYNIEDVKYDCRNAEYLGVCSSSITEFEELKTGNMTCHVFNN